MSWFEGRRFWIVLLVVSLGANGVLAGIVARGAFVSASAGEESARPAIARGRFSPRSFVAALPEERRSSARRELREGLRELRPLFSELIGQRRELNALLRAETFDEAAVLAVMAQIRATRARIDAGGEAVIVDIVSDLDPEVRSRALEAAYGSRGPRSGRRGGPHHREHRREPGAGE